MKNQNDRPKYHHGNLREELLQTGLLLLEKKGTAGLSLRELANVSGVSHNAPYRHFRDKSMLLTALAQIGFEELAATIDAAAKKHPDNAEQQIIEAGEAYIVLAKMYPELYQLMFGGITRKEGVLPELKAAANKAHKKIEDIISHGKNEGIFKGFETNQITLAAWALVHGVAALNNAGYLSGNVSSMKTLKETGRSLASMLLKGLLK